MNTQEYLGLDNAYAQYLTYFDKTIKQPYIVDENLRETPVVPDHSFIRLGNKYACNYFAPVKNTKNIFLYLSESEYEDYIYIRNNAFYTPYGVMVLIESPYNCINSFNLMDNSLIPKSRTIEYADKNGLIHSFGYKCPYLTVAFFADYIMENFLIRNLLATVNAYPIRTDFCEFPVLMKRFRPMPNIPLYDVQFNDLMLFSSRLDYDLYMMLLTRYLYGDTADSRKISMYIDNKRRFHCRPIDQLVHIKLDVPYKEEKSNKKKKNKKWRRY